MRESPETAQDRLLGASAVAVGGPVVEPLGAVAEPLAPSVVPVVGVRLRQPDVPGGKRAATVETFREGTAPTFKGRQIDPLCSRR
jgi:hypothetical protein